MTDAQKLAEAERIKEQKMRERDAKIQAAIEGPTTHTFSDQDKTPQGQKAIALGIKNKQGASYDYTKAPGADFSWPDYLPEEIGHLEPWLLYKPSGEGGWIDLNTTPSGAERKAKAAYRLLGLPLNTPGSEVLSRVTDEAWSTIEKLSSLPDAQFLPLAPKFGLKQNDSFTYRDYLLGLKLEFQDLKKRGNKQAQRAVDAAMDFQKKEMDGAIAAAKSGGLLDPIQGVTMEDWAGANAKIAAGESLANILKVLKIEQPAWDAVSAEWMGRMSRDTTFAISTVYGAAFTNPNIGKFASSASSGSSSSAAAGGSDALSKVLASFELYVKVMTHQNVGASQGQDAASILKKYGLSVVDWSKAGAHWAPKMTSDISLATQMGGLMSKYTAEFSKPGAGDDISF